MKARRPLLILGLALLAAAGAAAALAGGTGSKHSAATPQRGGSITIARIEDSQSFDKTNVFQNESIWLAEQIMEPLYTVTADGKSEKPWLATSYTVSNGGKTYTFKLRQGVKFSNGQPMTSADVKFSLDDARAQSKGWGFLDTAIKNITAPSPDTVVVNLKYKWAPFLADIALFANGIIPNNFAGQTRKAFYSHPIGTGPFMWDKRVVGQSVTLQAQPDLLADGEAVPRLGHLDVRHRREHARAAAARQSDPGRRVPAVQLDLEAAAHERRDDDAVPVDAHRLPGHERAVRAARRRARPARDLVRDRPPGDHQVGALRLRQAGQLVPAAGGAVLQPERRRPAVQHGAGEGRDGEVEVPERLQGVAARRRRRAGREPRTARSCRTS